MVRKIEVHITGQQLEEDLEKYGQRALELGAHDAKIITTDMVVIDERVLAKCVYPKCDRYGTNANCPPYAMPPEQVRKIVRNFHHAVFLKLEVPSTDIAGIEAKDKNLTVPARNKMQEIVAKIEAEAFFDGYHLALGFACGSCKSVFCPDKRCSALIPGRSCRFPLKARASMEAVGMDAFLMAARVGWEVYPIGVSLSPSEVPYGWDWC
jgi:predicted metal-binding protein